MYMERSQLVLVSEEHHSSRLECTTLGLDMGSLGGESESLTRPKR